MKKQIRLEKLKESIFTGNALLAKTVGRGINSSFSYKYNGYIYIGYDYEGGGDIILGYRLDPDNGGQSGL